MSWRCLRGRSGGIQSYPGHGCFPMAMRRVAGNDSVTGSTYMLHWLSECLRNLAGFIKVTPHKSTTVPKLGKVSFPRLHCFFKCWHLKRRDLSICVSENGNRCFAYVDPDILLTTPPPPPAVWVGALGSRSRDSQACLPPVCLPLDEDLVWDSGRPSPNPRYLFQLFQVLSDTCFLIRIS